MVFVLHMEDPLHLAFFPIYVIFFIIEIIDI